MDGFKKFMRYYNEELPCRLEPNTYDNKLSTMVKVFSIAYNKNLVPFFQWWKWPILADTIEATKNLPVWSGIIEKLETGKETRCPNWRKETFAYCCTDEKPCEETRGNCNQDSNCVGDLKCGTDNCPQSNSTWISPFLFDDDCCYKP